MAIEAPTAGSIDWLQADKEQFLMGLQPVFDEVDESVKRHLKMRGGSDELYQPDRFYDSHSPRPYYNGLGYDPVDDVAAACVYSETRRTVFRSRLRAFEVGETFEAAERGIKDYLVLRLDDIYEKTPPGRNGEGYWLVESVWSDTRSDFSAIDLAWHVNRIAALTGTEEELAQQIVSIIGELANGSFPTTSEWRQHSVAESLLRQFSARYLRNGRSKLDLVDLPVNAAVIRQLEEKPVEWHNRRWGHRLQYGQYDLESIERLEAKVNTSRLATTRESAQADVLRMIENTFIAAQAVDAPFAGVIADELERHKAKVGGATAAVTIPYAVIPKLANSLLTTINEAEQFKESPLKPLPIDILSLPEAFRRLLFVAFGGKEVIDHQDGLVLQERLKIVDRFVMLLDSRIGTESVQRSSRIAPGRTAVRGSMPTRGPAYWNRWKPSYGVIS